MKDIRYIYIVGLELENEEDLDTFLALCEGWGATDFGRSFGDTWTVWFGEHFFVGNLTLQGQGYSGLTQYFTQNEEFSGAIYTQTLEIDEGNFFSRLDGERIVFDRGVIIRE